MNDASQAQTSGIRDEPVRVIHAAELVEIGGGLPCSYLGVEDWKLMMSYETRNYCC